MTGKTLAAEVAIRFRPHDGGRLKRLLATADFILYFRDVLPDMKVTGLSLWRGEDATVTLTLPAGPGSAGEYYCFRPVSGDVEDVVRFKQQVIEAYNAWAAAPPGSCGDP